MLEQSLRDRIEVYLKRDYLEIVSDNCELWEKKIPGRTRLKVVLPDTVCALCITDYDNKSKCEFLNDEGQYGLRKSVDHVLLTPNSNGKWTAHLIEMKSSMNKEKWKDISQKTCASMLNVKALAAVLEMSIESFKVYTTYDHIVLHESDPTSIVTRKHQLGGGWKESEWDKDRIHVLVPKGEKIYLTHKGIQMMSQMIDGEGTLCGELALS